MELEKLAHFESELTFVVKWSPDQLVTFKMLYVKTTSKHYNFQTAHVETNHTVE